VRLTRELAWQAPSRRVPSTFRLPSRASLTQHDMSTHLPARPYRLYPAYYYSASPTYDAWVKLTIADVQALRSEREFPGDCCKNVPLFATDFGQDHIFTSISTTPFDMFDSSASL
jgi:hypothetical protein